MVLENFLQNVSTGTTVLPPQQAFKWWGLRAFPSYQICLLSLAGSSLCQDMTLTVCVLISFFHLPSVFPGLPSVGNLGLGTFPRAIPVTGALGKWYLL